MATGNDIILDAKDYLGEMHGSPAFGRPTLWETLYRNAIDEICRHSFCCRRTLSYAVAANQSQVLAGACTCELFEITEARITLSDGVTNNYLEILTPDDFRHSPFWSYDWRAQPSLGGSPYILVDGGPNDLSVFPPPGYSIAQTATTGLLLTGYGNFAGKDSSGNYLLQLTDECPIRDQQLVRTATILQRAEQMPDLYGNRIPLLRQRYENLLGYLSASVREHNPVSNLVTTGAHY